MKASLRAATVRGIWGKLCELLPSALDENTMRCPASLCQSFKVHPSYKVRHLYYCTSILQDKTETTLLPCECFGMKSYFSRPTSPQALQSPECNIQLKLNPVEQSVGQANSAFPQGMHVPLCNWTQTLSLSIACERANSIPDVGSSGV
jgi:hypothetical protein